MEDEEIQTEKKDPTCPRCGLRAYDSECAVCGTPIIDKKDEEEEEYDWREKKR
jgi:ribosomal protein L37E